LSRTVL